MRNEGWRNGAIELGIAIVLLLLMRFLDKTESTILLIAVIVGSGVYILWQKYRKRKFPIVFNKPDQNLRLDICHFYEKMQIEMEKKESKNSWIKYVVGIFYFIIMMVFYKESKDNFFAYLMFWFTFICFIGVFIISIGPKIYYNIRFKSVSGADLEVAKVEFYDCSYDRHGKTITTFYYIFVEKNGEKMKMQVSESSFYQAASTGSGEGYLIKNSKGDGVYDVYDFMPV